MLLHNSVSLNFRGYQVCSPKTRRCIGLLLALCLSASPAWAASSQQPAWKQNMKVGIEIGFGAPYNWAINKEGNRAFNIGGRVDNMKVSPNWRVGVIGGYGFPFLDDTLAIGPDIGLFLGTKRRF